MLNKIARSGLVVIGMSLAAPAVAVPITGDVDMAGRFNTDSGSLGTATTLLFTNAWTTAGTGVYEAVNGTTVPVVYNSFTFSPALSGTVDPLWIFSVGGSVFSFALEGVGVTAQSGTQLALFGTGTLYATGYDPTPGVWEFSATSIDGRFKFTSETSNVPEPGTLALLGIGLIGVGLVRRRTRK